MKDAIGDRMKENYENRSRFSLPRRSYTLIRVDGKAFHTYTRVLIRPFDDGLMDDMDTTAAYLCQHIMGAKLAFVQSDEISVLLTDFEELGTEAWFDNNLQMICSVSASMATAKFNESRLQRHLKASNFELNTFKWAEFDSRVFQNPQRTEVENYFIWRQQDTTRNSIAAVAQSLYSHKQLHGKTSDEQQELIFQKGINWNDYAAKYKRGRVILKETYEKLPDANDVKSKSSLRTRWVSVGAPIFTQERDFLRNLIPENV
jgi:tRNA(His) guanylyltransferase